MLQNSLEISSQNTHSKLTNGPMTSTTINNLDTNLNEITTFNNENNFKNKLQSNFNRPNLKNNFFYSNTHMHFNNQFYPSQMNNNNHQFFSSFHNAKNFYGLSSVTYQDRRNYLKTKKEQNMHKLWPHTVNTPMTSEPNCTESKEEEVKKNVEGAASESKYDSQLNTETVETVKKSESNDKTPMCLIHELVKFNKIKNEYVLLDEKGPAHKKTFYVQLKLGVGLPEEESYQSSGNSIKKAQHKAAEIALNETKFKKPTPRVKSNEINVKKVQQKPTTKNKVLKPHESNTVKLNSLCMKLGIRANYEHQTNPMANIYTSFNTSEYKPFVYQPAQMYPNFGRNNFNYPNQFQFRNKLNYRIQRNGSDLNGIYSVKLKIVDQEFMANGESLQAAKHKAAEKALEYFSQEENMNKAKKFAEQFKVKVNNQKNGTHNKDESDSKPTNESKSESKVTILSRVKSPEQENIDQNEISTTDQKSINQTKSEISILLEFSYRQKKPVKFELVNESGPSHIKKFVTKCSIGTKSETNSSDQSDEYIEVFGEGNSKKQSKQKSAIELLKKLREKYDMTQFESQNTKKEALKKPESKITNDSEKKQRKPKPKNIVVLNKTTPEYGNGTINPITRLNQIQQAKKESEPIFDLVSSINRFKRNDYTKSRSEFTMSVTVKCTNGETHRCEGKGTTKKMAKHNAAEAMLIKLGYPTKPVQTNIKPALKMNDETNNETLEANKQEKKVKFIDQNLPDGDEEKKKVNKLPKSNQQQQKVKIFKDQLTDIDKLKEPVCLLDKNEMGLCAKISSELLDSINMNESEFYSKTAEDYLGKKEETAVITAKDFNDTLEGRVKFKILNNGSEINYKAALDFVANIFNIKCNYQSILGRDGSVNSYLTLSILSNTDKPFSGQGATFIQSSNIAALNALQYLANHHKK
ncbi:unnamed protein product [Brachionus calyciflorus]|uniref:DRBM domain-containing protein n=1 Tax=Brachionus calyciflorus TaxID=104777 RepID=A0A814B444_9BILA|nr:unnamed protein product [Brachionus calyciflorus]